MANLACCASRGTDRWRTRGGERARRRCWPKAAPIRPPRNGSAYGGAPAANTRAREAVGAAEFDPDRTRGTLDPSNGRYGIFHRGHPGSLRLDARKLDHLAPLLGLRGVRIPKSAGKPGTTVPPRSANRARETSNRGGRPHRQQAPATYFNHVFRKSVGVNPVRRNADEK